MKLLRLVGMGSQVLNDWVREIISNMYETTLDRVLEKIDNFLNLNLNSESSLSLLFLKIKCLEVKGDHGEILNIIEDLHQFPDHTYLKNIFQIIKLQIELYTKDKNEILNNVKILDSLNLNGVDKEYLIELHGDIFALRGDYNKAIEQFIQIDNSEFYLDYDREYRLKNKIAQSYRELKEYSQGFKYVNSMIEDQEINRYSPQLAIALNIKGIILSDLGKFDESIDYLNKSLSIKNRYKNPFEISKTYNNLATNYFYKGDYINAENFFLKSLAMRRATGDKRKIAHLCSNLAVFYNYINNYSKAIDYYNESITYFEELGNDIELSQAINNLGFLQFQNQEYLQAIENFNASLKLRKKIDNEEHIAETLYFLALTKYRLGYFKKAEKISVELLKYRETVGNKHHLADTLELLGGLSMHKGDLYESMQYFDRCKQYRLEIGNNHFTSNCYMEIAKLHRIKGEYNLALGMLTNALEFIDKLPLDKLRIDISYQIGLVHLENLDVTAAQNTIELMEQLISNQADTPSNKVPLELLKNKLNKLISGSIDNIHVRDLYDIIFSGKIKNIDLVSDIVLNLCSTITDELQLITNKSLFEKAFNLLAKLIEISEQTGSQLLLCEVYLLKARLYLVQNNQNAILENLNEAENIANSHGLGVIIDKTKNIRLNIGLYTKMINLNRDLQRSNEDLQNFVGIISHDLRNPLSIIAQSIELIKVQNPELFNNKDSPVTFIEHSTEKIQNILSSMVEMSKFRKIDHPHQLINFNDIITSIKTIYLKDIINTTGAKINIIGDFPVVYGDSTQIFQLLHNLIDNSIKYRKMDVIPEIVISSRSNDIEKVIEVIDNGIGINKKDIDNIFKMFQRGENISSINGSGIGLAICSRIMQNHNGTIIVESNDQITKFILTF